MSNEILKQMLQQGYKEEVLSNGKVIRTTLSDEQIESIRKIIAFQENPPPQRTAEDLAKLADKGVERQLREKNCCEVFAWLALSDEDGVARGFAGGMGSWESVTGTKAQKMMEHLRDIGAVRIDVVDPPPLEGPADELTAESFIITLPKDKEARKQIFKWQRQFSRKQGSDPYPDVGQKYLFLGWS